MKHIAPVRRALGVRTVFNILGPLANPAAPPYHVIGAYSETAASLMMADDARRHADHARLRDSRRGGLGRADAGTGTFLCFDVRPGRVERTVRDPLDLGLERCAAAELRGGDAAANAARLKAALAGGDTPSHRDALVLGAALALEVTGVARDAQRGVARAREALEDGAAARLLDNLAAFGRERQR